MLLYDLLAWVRSIHTCLLLSSWWARVLHPCLLSPPQWWPSWSRVFSCHWVFHMCSSLVARWQDSFSLIHSRRLNIASKGHSSRFVHFMYYNKVYLLTNDCHTSDCRASDCCAFAAGSQCDISWCFSELPLINLTWQHTSPHRHYLTFNRVRVT